MANTKIVLNRQSDLILDNALITNPQGIVLTDISGVSEAVASINTSTSTDISVETSSRVAADASLQNQIDFITNNSDPAAIDSLVEVVVAFQSADGDLNGAITNLANAATTDLSTEVVRATSVEAQLSDANSSLNLEFRNTVGQDDKGTETDDKWSQYVNYLNGQSTYNKPDGSGQISNSNFQDMFGPSNLFNFTEFTAYDERLSSQQERQSLYLDFRNTVGQDDKGTETNSKWNQYLDYINGQSTYNKPDGSGQLDSSSFNNMFGPANLFNFTEFTAYHERLLSQQERSTLNDDLQSQIDFITNNTDPAAIDSLTEIVAAFQSADGDINGAITALASTATSGLSTEVARAESAELVLTNDLSSEVSTRLAADASIAAGLSSEIEALADVDGTTIALNAGTNQIELKESIASPASGIRTFMGEVDVETVLKVAGVNVMATLSSEVSRAESAEASIAEELSSEVSYIMANTDLSSIDSFAEVVADLSSEVLRAESVELSLATDFANIYAKKVAVTETPNGSTITFTLANSVREGSEIVYLNGLSLDSGDYTANITDGLVVSVTFDNGAPSTGDKVKAYGVY